MHPLFGSERRGRVLAAGQRGLDLATSSANLGIEIVARNYLGAAYHRAGDFRQSVDITQCGPALLTSEQRSARFGQVALPAATAHGVVAWGQAELGDFAMGYRAGEEAVRLAEAFENP